jgi:hypothetical protein
MTWLLVVLLTVGYAAVIAINGGFEIKDGGDV